jgi:tetratricopeptide (TPR) repeat protein
MAKHNLQQLYADATNKHRLGQFAPAERLYREILRNSPDSAEIHNSHGAVLASMGKVAEASEAFRRATRLEPNNARFRTNYGNALLELGKVPESIHQYQAAIRSNPNHLPARFHLGLAYKSAEQWEESIEQFYRVCELNPGHPDAFEQLGSVLLELLRFENAAECFQRALQLSPDSSAAHLGMAEALLGLRKADEAVAWLQKSIARFPQSRELKLKLGRALQESGQNEEAFRQYFDLFNESPTYAPVYLSLASAKRFLPEDEKIAAQLEQVLQTGKLDTDASIYANFALGKIHDDLKQFDAAFKHYEAGNALKNREFSGYSAEQHHQYIDSIISAYSTEFFSGGSGIGCDSHQPVVVVGMPRSGTTLTEQIISSHPLAAGAGEVPFWGPDTALPIELDTRIAYPECIRLIDPASAGRIGNKYLSALQTLAPGNPARIVDKMPHNFLVVGLIARIFPNAKIIHVSRDPMDNCLSIYFQYFLRDHPYAYDFSRLGQYYRDYQRLMQHWREVLPGRMLEISYEDIVADQAAMARKLIEFVDLPWDERCLEPHKNRNVVRTASIWQARQAVYKTSLQRWKNYESHLAPLKEALG